MQDKTVIRNAATIIVVRDRLQSPKILMGQRGAAAAFMPSKYVFPGGAVDPNDADLPAAAQLPAKCADRLGQDSDLAAPTIAMAAIRELWEETGLILGQPGLWPVAAPAGWRGFAASGFLPDLSGLRFVFRAVTPKGLPRRFDARFFLVDAQHVASDLDDFSRAEDELGHLHWVPLSEARALDLPFITEVVLAEIARGLADTGPPASVPYFRNDDEAHFVERLKGARPLDSLT